MSVVARRGYAGATTPQVASAAGLAPGLIHYHFQSKQELLLELARGMDEARRDSQAAVEASFESVLPAERDDIFRRTEGDTSTQPVPIVGRSARRPGRSPKM